MEHPLSKLTLTNLSNDALRDAAGGVDPVKIITGVIVEGVSNGTGCARSAPDWACDMQTG